MEIPTGFMEIDAHGFHIVTRPAYHDKAVEIARQDPENLLADAAPPGPMQGRGSRLVLPGESGETILIKKQKRGGLYGKLRGDIHRSDRQAMAEVIISEHAWKKGVPVGLLAFAMSADAGPGKLASYRRAYSAAIMVPGARSLMEWLTSPLSEGQRRGVLAAAAAATRRAHDCGLSHGDLTLGNILVTCSEQGEFNAILIDLTHSTLGRVLVHKPRLANLVRLYRSAQKWLPEPDARRRRREIVRFLRVYTKGERGETRRFLKSAAGHRGSLFLHRLSWRIGGGAGRVRRRSTAPAGR